MTRSNESANESSAKHALSRLLSNEHQNDERRVRRVWRAAAAAYAQSRPPGEAVRASQRRLATGSTDEGVVESQLEAGCQCPFGTRLGVASSPRARRWTIQLVGVNLGRGPANRAPHAHNGRRPIGV